MKEYVWPRPNLKQLAVLGPQYGANAGAVSPTGSRPRYVRITDVTDDGTLLPSGAMEADLSDPENYSLERGDLLFARSGATVGKTYLYDEADGPCVFAGYMIRFRINEAIADPKYVFYFTKSPEYQAWVGSKQRAAAQPNINGKEYSALTLPMPPLSEQRRIVEILDHADALRKKRAEADRKAERLLSALFLHTFGDPATNPMGWKTKPLTKCFDIVGGGTPSKGNERFWSGEIPWVSPKDMKFDIIVDTEDHITPEAVEGSATRLIPEGMPLIVYRSGILAHTFPVALTGRSMALNQDLKALLPIGKLPPSFIFGWIKTATTTVMSCVKKGATVHNVDGNRFKMLEIMQPDDDRLRTFDAALKGHLEAKGKREESAKKVTSMWEVLLHQAFSGDLTTSWREGRMKELLREMEEQAKLLSTTGGKR